jgi:hypothetical protein
MSHQFFDKANTQATFSTRNQLLRARLCHLRQIVDIQIALPAEANTLITKHVVPISFARRCNANMIKWAGECDMNAPLSGY